jgi:hypothetical protein
MRPDGEDFLKSIRVSVAIEEGVGEKKKKTIAL